MDSDDAAVGLVMIRTLLRVRARSLGVASQDAEDCVQETYLRVWLHVDEIRNPHALTAYCLRTLRAVVYDAYKLQRRRSEREVPLFEASEVGEADSYEESTPTLHAVEALAPPYRLAIQCAARHAGSETVYRDVALEMHLPMGTVKSRLCRARGRIIARLGRERTP